MSFYVPVVYDSRKQCLHYCFIFIDEVCCKSTFFASDVSIFSLTPNLLNNKGVAMSSVIGNTYIALSYLLRRPKGLYSQNIHACIQLLSTYNHLEQCGV